MSDSEQFELPLPQENPSPGKIEYQEDRDAYYLDTVGLTTKQLHRLGGAKRLDRMAASFRNVLLNDVLRLSPKFINRQLRKPPESVKFEPAQPLETLPPLRTHNYRTPLKQRGRAGEAS